MQNGQHCFQRRLTGCRNFINWNTTSIIGNTYPAIGFKRNIYASCRTGQRFIYRVIYKLPNNVMEAFWARATNIHTRAFANRLKTL
jgi:hypothetical protein